MVASEAEADVLDLLLIAEADADVEVGVVAALEVEAEAKLDAVGSLFSDDASWSSHGHLSQKYRKAGIYNCLLWGPMQSHLECPNAEEREMLVAAPSKTHTWAELALAVCSRRLPLQMVQYLLRGTNRHYMSCSNCAADRLPQPLDSKLATALASSSCSYECAIRRRTGTP